MVTHWRTNWLHNGHDHVGGSARTVIAAAVVGTARMADAATRFGIGKAHAWSGDSP